MRDLGFLLLCVRKHYNHKQLVKWKGLLSLTRLRSRCIAEGSQYRSKNRAGVWRQELAQESWRALLTMLPVACSASFPTAPMTTRLRTAPLPRMGSLKSIISQENVLHAYPQINFLEAFFFSTEVPFSKWL